MSPLPVECQPSSEKRSAELKKGVKTITARGKALRLFPQKLPPPRRYPRNKTDASDKNYIQKLTLPKANAGKVTKTGVT
jgi:hypothetical protein